MFGGIARITANVGNFDELVAFLKWDAVVSRGEIGTLRFDVWIDPSTPDSVVLYEAYLDAEAFKMHQAAEPFQKFVAEIVPNLIDKVTFIVPFGTSAASNADPPA